MLHRKKNRRNGIESNTPLRLALLAVSAWLGQLAWPGPVHADQIIGPVNNDSLTSLQLTNTSYVQGVRPLVEQRGTGIDGSYNAAPQAAMGGPSGRGMGGGGGGSEPPPGGGEYHLKPFPIHRGGGGVCGGGGPIIVGHIPLGGVGGTQGANAPGGVMASGITSEVVDAMNLPSEGLPWTWSLSYNPRQKNSGGSYISNNGPAGYDWFNNAQMEIRMFTGASDDKDVMYLFYGADRYAEFKRYGTGSGRFVGSNGSAGVFAKTAAVGGEPETYTLTDLVGNQFVFFGFDSNAGVAKGQLWKMIAPDDSVSFVGDDNTGSTAISNGFNGSGQITKAYDASDRRYTLTYSSGHITQIKAETKTSGTWSSPSGVATVGTVDMTYYGVAETYGANGDLKLITVTTPLSTGGTDSVGKMYFRYWQGTYNAVSNPGQDHDIQYVYEAEGLRQYDWAGDSTFDDDFLTETENNLKPYASAYYKYDSDHRIVESWSNGGCGCSGASTGTYVYRYESNGSYTDTGVYDTAWKSRIVVKEPDKTDGGTTNRWTTVYVDEAGQGLSRVVTDDDPAAMVPPNFWMTAVTRGSDGLVSEVDTPAAVSTYTNSTGAFTKQSSAGLITTYTRISSTDTKGLPQHIKYQTGSSGTAYLARSIYYDISSLTIGLDAVLSRPAVKSTTVYTTQTTTSDTGPGHSPPSGAFRTEMTNTFRTSADVLKLQEVLVTLPAVSTGKNGSNSSDTFKSHFARSGRVDFRKSADGIVGYTAYVNGQPTKMIQDADTTLTSGGQDFNGVSIPSGYSCSSCSDAFHMKRETTYDAQGRSASNSDYTSKAGSVRESNATYITKLADGRIVTLQYAKVSGGNYYGPVSFTVTNLAGSTEAQGVIKLDDNGGEYTSKSQANHIDETQSDILLAVNWHATNRIGTVARLSTNVYDEVGTQVQESRSYFLIPASGVGSANTNYDATIYAYDNNGHRWRTEEPNGTVHRTVYDTVGRPVSQWIGTNDNDATFPGGDNAGTADMVKVSATEYDGGNPKGNNLVTTSTQYIQASTTGQRVTTYLYDVRGRSILQTNPTAPHTLNKYDDAGHLIATGQYSSASGLTATSDPTAVSTNRLALMEYAYDELGQQYQTTLHEIVQSSGADNDSLVTDLKWFDAAGRVIKTMGGNMAKTLYDRLGRAVRQYQLGDNNDASYSDADDVTGDIVMSESITTYDEDSGLVIMTATIDRFHDDVGGGATTGDLDNGGDGDPHKFTAADVKGRIQISANWYDSIDRLIDTVRFGTYSAADFDRDAGGFASAPARSDTALRTTFAFNPDGSTLSTTDPMNVQTRYLYDDLGRQTAVISNYVNGTPSSPPTSVDDVYTRFTYANGLKTEMWVDFDGDGVKDTSNPKDETTEYVYGVAKGASAGDSLIGSGSLLYKVIYPPQTGGQAEADRRVMYAYNAQGQVIWQKDAETNVKEFNYDTSGRQTQQCLTTLGGSFDSSVLRIARTYDNLGRMQLVTQYDNATVGSGSVVNEVKYTYADWGPIVRYEQNDSGTVSGSSDYGVRYTVDKSSGDRSAIIRKTKALYYNNTSLASMSYEYSNSSSYDENLARVTDLKIGLVKIAEYRYNGMGTVVGTVVAGARYFNNRYNGGGSGSYPDLDIFNRVTSDTWWRDLSTDRAVYDVDWSYDRNSNPTVSQDNVFSTGRDVQYTMDALNRLTKAEEGDWSGSAITSRTRQQIWTLTATGNWDQDQLDLDGNGTFTGTGEHNDHRTHNQPNEITGRDTDNNGSDNYTLTYDKDGNLLDDGANYKYVMDGWNRVKQVKNQSNQLIEEFWYNGENHRVAVKYDTDADGDVDSSDKKYHSAYDERWRVVATYRESDTAPKEEFWHHAAGFGGYDGSSYIDAIATRDKDANSGWISAADGVLERRDTYLANWRSDVVVLVSSSAPVEHIRYSAYGVPSLFIPGDTNGDCVVDSTDTAQIQTWINGSTYNVLGDLDLDSDVDNTDKTLATANIGISGGRGLLSQGGATGTISNRIGYAGYQFDQVNLDNQWNVRYRQLDGEQGRWITRDILEYMDGPNFYAFGLNRPVIRVDPTGLHADHAIKIYTRALDLTTICPEGAPHAEATYAFHVDPLPTGSGWIIQLVAVNISPHKCEAGDGDDYDPIILLYLEAIKFNIMSANIDTSNLEAASSLPEAPFMKSQPESRGTATAMGYAVFLTKEQALLSGNDIDNPDTWPQGAGNPLTFPAGATRAIPKSPSQPEPSWYDPLFGDGYNLVFGNIERRQHKLLWNCCPCQHQYTISSVKPALSNGKSEVRWPGGPRTLP